MRTSIPKNNFSSGQVDRDLKGRVDLPLLQNGHEISRNFFHTVKGDCYYRSGFEYLDEIGKSALYEFRFNTEQSYLLVFRTQYIEFWSYNANNQLVQVLDNNGRELTLVHPYGTEIFNLCMTQNSDVLYINHINGQYPEYKLKRTASNAFTLDKTTFTNTNSTKSLSSESESEYHGFPCTCTFYENRLNRCSSSKYPTYLYGSKGGDYDNITTGTGTNDGYQFDLAEANSKALWLVSGSNSLLVGTAEGILTVNGGSVSSAITPTDIAAKLSCRDGVSSVRPIHKDNFVFFVSSNRRLLYAFEYDVLLEQFKATNLSKGNYEITKGGIKKLVNKTDRFGLIYVLCGTRLLSVCFSSDEAVNSWSEFITDGDFIDICSVTRPDGNCDLFANIKRKINGIEKYYLERLTETVEFSRFEDYVSEVPSNATNKEIYDIEKEDKYTFYRQIAEELRNCNYLDCSMSYSGLRTNDIEYNPETSTISLDIEELINSIYNGNYSSALLSNGFIKIDFNSEIVGVNSAKTNAVGIYSNFIQTNLNDMVVGANLYKIVNKSIYESKYVSAKANAIKYNNLNYNSLTLSENINVCNGKYKTTTIYYRSSLAKNNTMYAYLYVNGSYTLLTIGTVSAVNTTKKTITINADTITPSENYYIGEILSINKNSNSINIGYYKEAFKSSDIGKKIWYKSKTGKEYGIFEITDFINNYQVIVKTLVPPNENRVGEWYLSATYFTGLEHLEGEIVSVVGNGGYIGDYLVKNGEIDISNANVNKVGSAVIGLKYKGILKSPNLGLMLQGTQTFTNMKNIFKIGLELSFSSGGKIGESLYHLDEIQDFNTEGLFDIPPLPIDNYKEINYQGTYEKNKHYYIVQDSPLPFHLTMIVPYCKHVSVI